MIALVTSLALPMRVAASVELPTIPRSMGQPDQLRISWGVNSGYDFIRDQRASRVFLEILPEAFLPQIGFCRLTSEISAGLTGDEVETAMAAHVRIPFLRGGVEFNSLDQKVTPDLALQFALKRQGLFGFGDQVRIDYRPKAKECMIGVVFERPFRRYQPTRPRLKYASIPKPTREPPGREEIETLPEELARSLSVIDHSVEWMDRLLTPRFEFGDDFAKSADEYRAHIRLGGHSFAEEDANYHRELRTAFTIAAAGDTATGNALATIAEATLLRRVLVPYNGLFAQKKKPRYPDGFLEQADAAFVAAVAQHPRFTALVPSAKAPASKLACVVFRSVLGSVARASRVARERWKLGHLYWEEEARLVWLPLNYGLRPEQYDTQPEWDSVLEMVTGERFTDANRIDYLLGERFHPELKKMIRETETYQVFIIHDFRGRHHEKNVTDVVGWDVVVDGYLRSFTDAVREIDSGKRARLPQFILFLDQNFYEDNHSRQIITFLENFYDEESDDIRLTNKQIENRVRAARRELVSAIQASPALSKLGGDRLRGLFKVHVNVTNPFDPGFVFDADKRDHRKLAFRDVTEEDPASGAALLTGQGVGEHYNGAGWEDRSVRVQGPAILELKRLAERLFLSQGFAAKDVPECLRTRSLPESYGEQCRALRDDGWTTPMLIAANETGYGAKQSSALKAAMYNLLPAEAMLFTFDSLWISDFWASMFISAAVRGARVYPIAPPATNAPSDATFTLALMRENLELMIQARHYFADDIARAGGDIRVGVYAHEFLVDDRGRLRNTFREGLEGNKFLTDLFQPHPAFLAAIAASDSDTPAPDGIRGVRPRLHLKLQFLADKTASDYLRAEDWAQVFREYTKACGAGRTRAEGGCVSPLLLRAAGNGICGDLNDRDAGRRGIVTLTTGSHNQDRRGMLFDGEVLGAVSGHDGFVAWLDVLSLAAASTWPADIDEFERVFPVQEKSGSWRRFYRLFQDLI